MARNGHVYRLSAEMKDILATDGRPQPTLVGINKASTFWGFCAHHDSTTFRPIECETLVPTPEQRFLLAYRPLVKELHAKLQALKVGELMRSADRGRSLPHQVQLQTKVHQFLTGTGTAARDLQAAKQALDNQLLARDFSRVESLVLRFSRAPTAVCSGCVQPTFSFTGTRLQDLRALDVQLDLLSFALVRDGAAGLALFTWLAERGSACRALMDSLRALDQSLIPDAIFRFACSEFENTFVEPHWWENLSSAHRGYVHQLFMNGVRTDVPPDPLSLTDRGHHIVDWTLEASVPYY